MEKDDKKEFSLKQKKFLYFFKSKQYLRNKWLIVKRKIKSLIDPFPLYFIFFGVFLFFLHKILIYLNLTISEDNLNSFAFATAGIIGASIAIIFSFSTFILQSIRKTIREIERTLRSKGLIFMVVRKRKFRRFYPKLTIIEKYGKQKARYKVIASRTYVPIEGGEKGLIHYLFNKELIKKEFKSFKIYNIWINSVKRHYCFLGELRS